MKSPIIPTRPQGNRSFRATLSVLIVDPVEADQRRVAQVFTHHEVAVTACQEVNQALEHVQDTTFDFICVSFPLDQVPDSKFFRSLKASEGNKRTPVFVLTAGGVEAATSDLHEGLVKVFHKQDLSGLFEYITGLIGLIQKNCFFKGRLLYVDASAYTAKTMMSLLHKMGLNVMQCFHGQKAIEAFAMEDYDLVVVTIGEKSASRDLAFIQTVRSAPGSKSQTPILAVCTTKNRELVQEALSKGANDYVGKRIRDEELQCRLKNLLLIKHLSDKVESQEKELRQLVMTDELTTLYSKPYLLNVASQRANEAYRHGFPFCLILLGLDRFHALNDRYGQNIGDMVLQEVAKMLKTFSRSEDIVARINDDEFALALPHCSEENAITKVDRLREFVESAKPSGIPITASFGVAVLPTSFPCDFEDVFSAADRAMAQAKSDGRNCAVMSELVPSDSGLLRVVLKQLLTQ